MKIGGLTCAECGCVSADGRGWAPTTSLDPDADAPPSTRMLCPPCAAAELGQRTEEAERYVCVWPPLPGEPSLN